MAIDLWDFGQSYGLWAVFFAAVLFLIFSVYYLVQYNIFKERVSDKSRALKYLLSAGFCLAMSLTLAAIGLKIYFVSQMEEEEFGIVSIIGYTPVLTIFIAIGFSALVYGIYNYLKRFDTQKLELIVNISYLSVMVFVVIAAIWGVLGLSPFLEANYLEPKWVFFMLFYLMLVMVFVGVINRIMPKKEKF